MKFNYSITIMIASILFSCQLKEDHKSTLSSEGFNDFKDHFVSQLWKISPAWASLAGLHEYDSILEIPTPEKLEKRLEILTSLSKELSRYNPEAMESFDRIDCYIIRDFVNQQLWYATEFKEFEWNPSKYNIARQAGRIINEDFADLTSRLKILSAYLKNVPTYYRQAAKNLTTPTLEHLNLGILQNNGSLSIFSQSLGDSVQAADFDDTTKQLLLDRIDSAKIAISNYVVFLESRKKELEERQAKRSRIGREHFNNKYRHDVQANYTAEEIYLRALEEKKTLHRQMYVITDSIWNNYLAEVPKPSDSVEMIGMLINEISENHVRREDFVDEIRRQIQVLSDFVDQKDLLTQDPTKPLIVRDLPPYMRGGGAGASINHPGPYEKNANTYYNVSPLDDYSEEGAENFLKEYNNYILKILNIHEAIPGHHTQLIYANKTPSIVRSLLKNGANVEGWACYAELMMLEAGYENSPEMWLMRGKWHLRSVSNTILDYSYHVLDLSKEEAMELMVRDAFQQQEIAERKWKRMTLSSVQLSSYFSGFSQIYDLREEIKEIEGEDFDLKRFHEEFLGYGAAPLKYIRNEMIKKRRDINQ